MIRLILFSILILFIWIFEINATLDCDMTFHEIDLHDQPITNIGYRAVENFENLKSSVVEYDKEWFIIKIVGLQSKKEFLEKPSKVPGAFEPISNDKIFNAGISEHESLEIILILPLSECQDGEKHIPLATNVVIDPSADSNFQVLVKNYPEKYSFTASTFLLTCPNGTTEYEDACDVLPNMYIEDGQAFLSLDMLPFRRYENLPLRKISYSWNMRLDRLGVVAARDLLNGYDIKLTDIMFFGLKNGQFFLNVNLDEPKDGSGASLNLNNEGYNLLFIELHCATTSYAISCSVKSPRDFWDTPLTFTLWDYGIPTSPQTVSDAENKELNISSGAKFTLASGLVPGTDYILKWEIEFKSHVPVRGSLKLRTLCTCGDYSSDAPVFVDNHSRGVYQEKGRIFFEFLGHSICGDSYKFSRQHHKPDGSWSTDEIFTPTYFYHRGKSCPTLFHPQDEACDDLTHSKLVVGDTYRYNLRASGSNYEGDIASISHTILWESSVSGIVSTGKNYGNLPVEGVHVKWYLTNDANIDILDQGSSITSSAGTFQIYLKKSGNGFTNDGILFLFMKFSKTTFVNEYWSLEHEFACNSGTLDCVAEFAVVHLQHLDFDVPVEVIDKSVIPISGKVFFDYTSDGWGGIGCPVIGAAVCLVDKTPGKRNGTEYSCVNTDNDGFYSLPGTFASFVSIKVTFHEHSFEYRPVSGGETLDNDKGFRVEFGKQYSQNNFADVSRTMLQTTVAGGICDVDMGKSSMLMKIKDCEWPGKPWSQDGLVDVTPVPLSNLEISLEAIEGLDGVSLGPEYIDLTKVIEDAKHEQARNSTSQQGTQSPASATDYSTLTNYLRFQYDGDTQLEIEFNEDGKGSCEVGGTRNMNGTMVDVTSANNHVLPSPALVTATIHITRNLHKDGKMCDAVEDSLKVQVINSLGLVPSDPFDIAYKEKVAKVQSSHVVQLLEMCNTGCVLDVKHDVDPLTNRTSNARVSLPLMTGLPNNDFPYTKNFHATTLETNPGSLDIEVLVTGDRKLDDGKAVGLPIYEPVLILRDPPGGGSFSFYENVQTTVRVEVNNLQEYHGLETNVNAGGGLKFSTQLCEGFGEESCEDTEISRSVLSGVYTHNSKDIKTFNQNMKSGGFTTTWSYSTSTNPFLVGENSDVFVIPNLDVQFALTDQIKWDADACAMSISTTTTFSISNPENAPALSFVSAYEIRNVEIPYLEKNIKSMKEDLNNTDDKDVQNLLNNNIEAAQDGIQGWLDALELNKKTKEAAQNGALVKPSEWFEKIIKPNLPNNFDQKDLSHNSRFISKDMISKAELRPSYNNSKNDTNFDRINMYSFSGGGSSFTYSLSHVATGKKTITLGLANENSDHSSKIGDATDFEMYGATVGTVNSAGYRTVDTSSKVHLGTEENELTGSIGFTLADPDFTDEFDVNVYIDPRYGTFVFETKGGISTCPHESVTSPGFSASLEITSYPVGQILASEPMVFEIELINDGTYPSSFVLRLDGEYSDGLGFSQSFPYTIDLLNPGETVSLPIEISRGPFLFEYPAVDLVVEVGCEAGLAVQLDAVKRNRIAATLANGGEVGDRKIVYAKPCPEVYLAGDLMKDMNFLVKSPRNDEDASTSKDEILVSLRNPAASFKSLRSMHDDPSTRLESVYLRYRRKGSHDDWSIGQMRNKSSELNELIDIDFVRQDIDEDEFGYFNVRWDVGSFEDGEYEMKVQSVCTEIEGAPIQFNSFDTQIIFGVLDHHSPKVFGLVKPHRELPVGQSIQIEFDQRIDCSKPYKFEIKAIIRGTDSVFTNENLLVVCDERVIQVQLDSAVANVDGLVGHKLDLSLTGVQDLYGNEMSSDVEYSAKIVDWTTDEMLAQGRNKNRQNRRLLETSNFMMDSMHDIKINPLEFNMDFRQEYYELTERMQENMDRKIFRLMITMLGIFVSSIFAFWGYFIFRSRTRTRTMK